MLTAEGKRTDDRHACAYRLDLYWEKAHLDLEYDGQATHIDTNRYEEDSIRSDTLRRFGIKVVRVTRRKIMDMHLFDEMSREVARDLGRRLRTERCPNFASARADLRRTVLPTGHSWR